MEQETGQQRGLAGLSPDEPNESDESESRAIGREMGRGELSRPAIKSQIVFASTYKRIINGQVGALPPPPLLQLQQTRSGPLNN